MNHLRAQDNILAMVVNNASMLGHTILRLVQTLKYLIDGFMLDRFEAILSKLIYMYCIYLTQACEDHLGLVGDFQSFTSLIRPRS